MKIDSLFVYGSLMFPEVLDKMEDEKIPFEPAVLKGYKLMTIKRDMFPTIVKSKNSEVLGMILYDLSKGFFDDFDDYEGSDYKKVKVLVKTNKGNKKAFVYVNVVYKKDELEKGWDVREFRKHKLDELIKEFVEEQIEEGHI